MSTLLGLMSITISTCLHNTYKHTRIVATLTTHRCSTSAPDAAGYNGCMAGGAGVHTSRPHVNHHGHRLLLRHAFMGAVAVRQSAHGWHAASRRGTSRDNREGCRLARQCHPLPARRHFRVCKCVLSLGWGGVGWGLRGRRARGRRAASLWLSSNLLMGVALLWGKAPPGPTGGAADLPVSAIHCLPVVILESTSALPAGVWG